MFVIRSLFAVWQLHLDHIRAGRQGAAQAKMGSSPGGTKRRMGEGGRRLTQWPPAKHVVAAKTSQHDSQQHIIKRNTLVQNVEFLSVSKAGFGERRSRTSFIVGSVTLTHSLPLVIVQLPSGSTSKTTNDDMCTQTYKFDDIYGIINIYVMIILQVHVKQILLKSTAQILSQKSSQELSPLSDTTHSRGFLEERVASCSVGWNQ